MRASTLFVASFGLWIIAKGRGGKYWALATTSDAGGVSSSAAGGASGSVKVFPLPSTLPDIKKLGDDLLKKYGATQ